MASNIGREDFNKGYLAGVAFALEIWGVDFTRSPNDYPVNCPHSRGWAHGFETTRTLLLDSDFYADVYAVR